MDNSGCAYSVDGDMRYMVYKWGFPCLDYSLEVSISWIYLLSLYNWYCCFCASHHLMPPSCSGVYAHDTVFNACYLFRFIDTRMLVHACHLAFITSLVGEFLTPLNLHVHISELRAYGFSWLLIRDAQRMHGLSADHPKPFSFQALLLISRDIFFVTRERPLYCS